MAAFLVKNIESLNCQRCGETHEYLTNNCVPLAFPERWRREYSPEMVDPVPEDVFVEYFAQVGFNSAMEPGETS